MISDIDADCCTTLGFGGEELSSSQIAVHVSGASACGRPGNAQEHKEVWRRHDDLAMA
jgi:hypothetical protein